MNNVFELKSVSISDSLLRDGSYRTFTQWQGVFSSRRKAEAYMQILIEKRKKGVDEKKGDYMDDSFFAFFVYMKRLDEGLQPPNHEVSEFQEVWSYYGDGSFYCHGSCDAACRKHFRGRSAQTILLRVGDPAWYWTFDRITPCMVSILPLTDVKYRRWVKKLGHEVGLDYTDDSYTVILYDNNHAHPNTWELFPFFGPISPRNLKRLMASRQEFDSRDK